ncbi:hypothetical protein BDK51DRAFT_34766 [Blyttiomyces helicus]|uniref:Uncharacterized protein n=1 Tax=Blyttiomyces helicus TaxID=388810 RepID=A0A4P9W9J1_9FUNG|nr:hypothetical protein BDK51DRAFT_34766 [Blyttiomyces helicus]|eukprot:RKO88185.1 hypothetical protein BDK51DRAFT_34766 [Blyttiomyces helicus]
MNVIRLLDSSGTTVMDSISAEYEDSFCLDTFGELVKQHGEAEPRGQKAFILARVQTWDHKQPDRAFYSYYNAWHLNKIMVKTQIYNGKKLIHRLHVLNPLTNTDIIGNVQYFIVKTPVTDLPPKPEAGPETQKILATAVMDPVVDGPVKEPVEPAPLDADGPGGMDQTAGNPQAQTPNAQRKGSPLKVDTHRGPLAKVINHDIPPPSPSVRQAEEGVNASWTISEPITAELLADEDIPVAKREVQSAPPGPLPASTTATLPPTPSSTRVRRISFFGSSSARRMSMTPRGGDASPAAVTAAAMTGGAPADDTSSSLQRSGGTSHGILMRMRSVSAGENYSTKDKTERAGEPPPGSSGTIGRRHTTFGLQPEGTAPMAVSGRVARSPVPAGAVTRFAVPVPKDSLQTLAPPTAKARRRSLSYSNAAAAGNPKATFHEWLQMIKEDQRRVLEEEFEQDEPPAVPELPKSAGTEERGSSARRSQGTPSPAGEKYDLVPSFGAAEPPPSTTTTSSTGRTGRRSSLAVPPRLDTIPDASLGSLQDVQSQRVSDVTVYDAVLFATDVDFLESSKIRAVFRFNALTSEDAALFEMPPVNDGVPGSMGGSPTGPARMPEEVVICCCIYIEVDAEPLPA